MNIEGGRTFLAPEKKGRRGRRNHEFLGCSSGNTHDRVMRPSFFSVRLADCSAPCSVLRRLRGPRFIAKEVTNWENGKGIYMRLCVTKKKC